MLRLRDLVRLDLLDAGKQTNNLIAVATLGVLLVTVTLLTTLCVVVPLWSRRGGREGRGAAARVLLRDRARGSC
jgi:hypothetical protein